MMTDAIYTELVMYHNRHGHNKHVLEDATHIERGHNPNCGDDLTLQMSVKDGQIQDAAFVGSGCAISTASMSIMVDLVKGQTVEKAERLTDYYLKMIRGETLPEGALDELEDAQVFESLKNMPARVKCGTLGWHCLKVILDQVHTE